MENTEGGDRSGPTADRCAQPDPDPRSIEAEAEPPADSGAAIGAKPDPLTAATPAELVTLMIEYRVWKGQRSYRDMAVAVNGQYSQSTFASIHKRKKIPKLDVVLAYIQGCGAGPEDLETWRKAWQHLARHALKESGET